ncbi:hypothetical protein B0H11DRAFT_2244121 [Mycena galericulata]|nr:hypothetical protein B0H11DRAFT_2244121 [Mycena galericulata]
MNPAILPEDGPGLLSYGGTPYGGMIYGGFKKRIQDSVQAAWWMSYREGGGRSSDVCARVGNGQWRRFSRCTSSGV